MSVLFQLLWPQWLRSTIHFCSYNITIHQAVTSTTNCCSTVGTFTLLRGATAFTWNYFIIIYCFFTT